MTWQEFGLGHFHVLVYFDRTNFVFCFQLYKFRPKIQRTGVCHGDFYKKFYPIKYSLFLIESGTVLLGFDNHKPKKHHLHIGNTEIEYNFTSMGKLLKDFWKLTSEKGYEQWN